MKMRELFFSDESTKLEIESLRTDIAWENYSDESVNHIFTECEKSLNETVAVFRRSGDRSYAVLGFFIATVSFSFTALLNLGIHVKSIPILLILAFACASAFIRMLWLVTLVGEGQNRPI
jgi:hypothetical protein